jgi:hypothetical protein
MLRILPSQKERVYRLCRVVRREARLGLSAMVLHDHPDTRACIRFGVVPVAAVHPWATRSNKIIRDLFERDTWRHGGGDPNRIVDQMEAAEQKAKDDRQVTADAELDDLNANAYRAIRYGRPIQVDYGKRQLSLEQSFFDAAGVPYHCPPKPSRHLRSHFRDLPPLPPLTGLQNGDRVGSPLPPEGTPAPSPKIVLTDL